MYGYPFEKICKYEVLGAIVMKNPDLLK